MLTTSCEIAIRDVAKKLLHFLGRGWVNICYVILKVWCLEHEEKQSNRTDTGCKTQSFILIIFCFCPHTIEESSPLETQTQSTASTRVLEERDVQQQPVTTVLQLRMPQENTEPIHTGLSLFDYVLILRSYLDWTCDTERLTFINSHLWVIFMRCFK